MNIKISDILRADGTSLSVNINEPLAGFDELETGFSLTDAVSFKGNITNFSGILKLEGQVKAKYIARCYRCLNEISGSMEINITENFVTEDRAQQNGAESYTYEGNYVALDKVFKDNIVLNLPMTLVCEEGCKGLCPVCGHNLNHTKCSCGIDADGEEADNPINPKMEELKKYFNK